MKVPPPHLGGAASSPRRCRLLAPKVPPPHLGGAASVKQESQDLHLEFQN